MYMSFRGLLSHICLDDTHVVVQVDLDAILSRAEMREEEEEVPQSEANKELLAAFKCTTLTFEETEKDMEMEGRSYGTLQCEYHVIITIT
jgi:hypothetical protein